MVFTADSVSSQVNHRHSSEDAVSELEGNAGLSDIFLTY